MCQTSLTLCCQQECEDSAQAVCVVDDWSYRNGRLASSIPPYAGIISNNRLAEPFKTIKNLRRVAFPRRNTRTEARKTLQKIQDTSDKASEARQAYVDSICNQHYWHEFATLTLKSPMVTPEQVQRVRQFYDDWLRERYFDHAEQLGQVRKTFNPKHRSGLGGDGPPRRDGIERKVDCPKDYVPGEWIRIPHTSSTTRRGPELLRYPVGSFGDQVGRLRRYWDAEGDDAVEGDDRGWRQEYVQDSQVHWDGPFAKRWKRYHTTMAPIYVLGLERHKSGAVHIHSIIHHRIFERDIRRDRGWAAWKRRYGRARVEPVNSQQSVGGYVSKYCIKDYANIDPSQEAELILSRFFGEQPLGSSSPPVVFALPDRVFSSSRKAPAASSVALWDESELPPSTLTNKITSARTGSTPSAASRRSEGVNQFRPKKETKAPASGAKVTAATRAWLAAGGTDHDRVKAIFQPTEPDMISDDQSPSCDVAAA